MHTIISVAAASLLSAASFFCDRGRRPEPPEPAAGRSFHLHIRAAVADADLAYDTIYRSAASRAFTVTDFRYYISDVRAVRIDNTELKLPQQVILVDPRRSDYSLGTLPEGDYKGLRLTVGLDSAVNHSDPTVFPPDHPLAIQTPAMHWNWNSGYLFMKLEGRVDTTEPGSGASVTEFFYHIGMDGMQRSIFIQRNFSVGRNSATGIRLKFDLAKMLEGIDLRHEISTHSFDNRPLAARIADRWPQALLPDDPAD